MFPDWIKPWIWLCLAVGLLVPLVIRKRSKLWGEPVQRDQRPVRFWLSLGVGSILAAGSFYDWVLEYPSNDAEQQVKH
ncbi:hypothetical protein E2493_18150 [Sphingomonas parva]|uniref:Uncharacterized protein n=1 Tax=Sphingomonas parva TaxID=2555898 RepID=A0A4Y8ZR42_9SPHN|nr:hypothetical protein [Sphingomonas parva]TFI56866.1 hypothetical protein E2493_18150 [Sphingomonas parva]